MDNRSVKKAFNKMLSFIWFWWILLNLSNEKIGGLTARFTDMCLLLRFQLALVKRGLLKITHTYVDFPFRSYSIQISRCIFVRQDKVTFVIPIMRNNFKVCVKNSSQPSIFLYCVHRWKPPSEFWAVVRIKLQSPNMDGMLHDCTH